MVHCRGCGKEIHETANECPSCGAPQNLINKDGKNKLVAALLAFFLGALGIHRFYLGQWWGIFYLLLCWTMIPSLVSFIETIVFLLTNQKSWDDKYNDGINSGENPKALIVVIVIIIGLFVGTAVLGVLAAIAIPAYQDYTTRAQVTEGLVNSSFYKTLLSEHHANTNDFVDFDFSNIGALQTSKYVDSISTDLVSDDTIVLVVTFKQSGVNSSIQGKEIRIATEDGGTTWKCGYAINNSKLTGNNQVKSRYMPSTCK